MIEQFRQWRDYLLTALHALNDVQISVLAREVKALAEHLGNVNKERLAKAAKQEQS